jgi:hypothetical protein
MSNNANNNFNAIKDVLRSALGDAIVNFGSVPTVLLRTTPEFIEFIGPGSEPESLVLLDADKLVAALAERFVLRTSANVTQLHAHLTPVAPNFNRLEGRGDV